MSRAVSLGARIRTVPSISILGLVTGNPAPSRPAASPAPPHARRPRLREDSPLAGPAGPAGPGEPFKPEFQARAAAVGRLVDFRSVHATLTTVCDAGRHGAGKHRCIMPACFASRLSAASAPVDSEGFLRPSSPRLQAIRARRCRPVASGPHSAPAAAARAAALLRGGVANFHIATTSILDINADL